jgi:hypothetical protein
MPLITYAAAVRHLNQGGVLDSSPEDADLVLKIAQASAIVSLYLKRPGEWDIESIADDDPEFALLQAAVFKVLGNLYRFRGDDMESPAPISPDVKLLLDPLRDPALA